jgi:hypothetical protein
VLCRGTNKRAFTKKYMSDWLTTDTSYSSVRWFIMISWLESTRAQTFSVKTLLLLSMWACVWIHVFIHNCVCECEYDYACVIVCVYHLLLLDAQVSENVNTSHSCPQNINKTHVALKIYTHCSWNEHVLSHNVGLARDLWVWESEGKRKRHVDSGCCCDTEAHAHIHP